MDALHSDCGLSQIWQSNKIQRDEAKAPGKGTSKAKAQPQLAPATPKAPIDGQAQVQKRLKGGSDAAEGGAAGKDGGAQEVATSKRGSAPKKAAEAGANGGSQSEGAQKPGSPPGVTVKVERQASSASLAEVSALLNRASTQDLTDPAALQELAQAATMAAAQQKEDKRAKKRTQEELKLHARRMRFYRTLDSALLSQRAHVYTCPSGALAAILFSNRIFTCGS